MTDRSCPHCYEDIKVIEWENGTCPVCNKNYSWEEEYTEDDYYVVINKGLNMSTDTTIQDTITRLQEKWPATWGTITNPTSTTTGAMVVEEIKDMKLNLTYIKDAIEITFIKGDVSYKLKREASVKEYENLKEISNTVKEAWESHVKKGKLLDVTTYHARCFYKKCKRLYGFI